jgi:hypothetical protein
METLIQIGGLYNLLLVIFHLMFRNIFSWDIDLRSLTFLNRAIMPVLNLALTFVFSLFAYISLQHTTELLKTPLGHSLLAGISLFWLFRAILQPLFFRLKHWVSYAFMLFFLAGSVLYAIPLISIVSMT